MKKNCTCRSDEAHAREVKISKVWGQFRKPKAWEAERLRKANQLAGICPATIKD